MSNQNDSFEMDDIDGSEDEDGIDENLFQSGEGGIIYASVPVGQDTHLDQEVSEDEDFDETGQAQMEIDEAEQRQRIVSNAYNEGTRYVSIELLLKEAGMEQYIADFVDAGEDLMEAFALVESHEIDKTLRTVERKSGFTFPRDHRCKIWKALRYRWFKAPDAANKPFIHESEIPLILVPKKGHRIRDNNTDFRQLDSDRQKMVIRKTFEDEIEGTYIVQEETYGRQSHKFYELLGLESTIHFWLNQDPRRMSREDPREEVLLNQVKEIELELAEIINQYRVSGRIRKTISRVFLIVKYLFILAAVFWFALAIVYANTANSPNPGTELFLSATYIRTSALYLMTFFFVYNVTRKRGAKQSVKRLKRMHGKCRLLYSEIISFRLKTHFVRLGRVPRYLDEGSIAEIESATLADLAGRRKRSTLGKDYKAYLNTLVSSGVLKRVEKGYETPGGRQTDDDSAEQVDSFDGNLALPGSSGFVDPDEKAFISRAGVTEDDGPEPESPGRHRPTAIVVDTERGKKPHRNN